MTTLAVAEAPPPQFQVIQLTGRLTRNPELIQLDTGRVCRMRLAIENMGRNETGHVDVSTFGKAGEAAARVVSKGWLVAVDSRLDYRHWVADDGANRSAIGVVGKSSSWPPLGRPRRP
jgi:single-stranded DNA-binding protein